MEDGDAPITTPEEARVYAILALEYMRENMAPVSPVAVPALAAVPADADADADTDAGADADADAGAGPVTLLGPPAVSPTLSPATPVSTASAALAAPVVSLAGPVVSAAAPVAPAAPQFLLLLPLSPSAPAAPVPGGTVAYFGPVASAACRFLPLLPLPLPAPVTLAPAAPVVSVVGRTALAPPALAVAAGGPGAVASPAAALAAPVVPAVPAVPAAPAAPVVPVAPVAVAASAAVPVADPSNWGLIRIPAFHQWVANNALPVEAQKLARFPALRVVEKRRTAFSTKQNENIIAAIGQCVGVALPAGQECDLCASKPNTRHFSGGCVVAPADAQSKYTACFNCVYYWKYKQCSQHQK